MFSLLNKQGVQSDSGFAIQITGRFTAEYREAGRKMTIEIEFGRNAGQPCIILYPGAFRHWDADTAELPAHQQKLLLSNFRDACQFLGMGAVLEE